MARPWRIQYEHAVYHITARGNNRQKIFLDDSDRESFLALAGRCAGRFSLRVFAFCLMDNHYHARLKFYRSMLEDCGISLTKVSREFNVSVSAVSHGLKRLKTQTPKSRKWTGKP